MPISSFAVSSACSHASATRYTLLVLALTCVSEIAPPRDKSPCTDKPKESSHRQATACFAPTAVWLKPDATTGLYGSLSTRIGSTRVARRAGDTQARSAMTPVASVTRMRMTGSVGVTPKT